MELKFAAQTEFLQQTQSEHSAALATMHATTVALKLQSCVMYAAWNETSQQLSYQILRETQSDMAICCANERIATLRTEVVDMEQRMQESNSTSNAELMAMKADLDEANQNLDESIAKREFLVLDCARQCEMRNRSENECDQLRQCLTDAEISSVEHARVIEV